MQTVKTRAPRKVRGKPMGKRVRSRSRRGTSDKPSVVAPVNPHAHSAKRVRKVFLADAPRQAAVRRDRKPVSAAVESTPRVVREPMTQEQLAERSRKRRERHRQRKMTALAELLADLGLELKEKEPA